MASHLLYYFCSSTLETTFNCSFKTWKQSYLIPWANLSWPEEVVSVLLLFSCSRVRLSAHTRLPCLPEITQTLPEFVHSNSCPLSQWCHSTISSSVTPCSFCPPSFPASGSFPVSQLVSSCGQSIGASASVLPMNIQVWFPLDLSGLIFLLSKGFSRVFCNTTVWKHWFFSAQPSLWSNSLRFG